MGVKDKLIVEFWQIENVVNMRVLNQPDTINRGCGVVLKLPGICIMSGEYPRIDAESDQLHIRGREREFDSRIACHSFFNDYQASKFINNAVLAISTLNFMLENDSQFCIDVDNNGMRNCIAGVNSDEWKEFKNGEV